MLYAQKKMKCLWKQFLPRQVAGLPRNIEQLHIIGMRTHGKLKKLTSKKSFHLKFTAAFWPTRNTKNSLQQELFLVVLCLNSSQKLPFSWNTQMQGFLPLMYKFCSSRAADYLQHFFSVLSVNWNTDLFSEYVQHVIHGLPVSSNYYCRVHMILQKWLCHRHHLTSWKIQWHSYWIL